jgi:hypothetical protein
MTARTRRTAILVLLAVFLVGGMVGWLLEDVADSRDWPSLEVEHDEDDGRGGDADPLDDDAEEAFLKRLGLSPEQYRAADRLLDEREDRLEDYWRGRIPEIEALVDSTRQEIRKLLTSDQQAAYDRWIAEQRTHTITR